VLLVSVSLSLSHWAEAAPKKLDFNMVPLSISSITADLQNGQLVANGLLGSQPFTAPLTLSARPNQADPTCPILHLSLGPINLDLLGLKVDTSRICLDITAHRGGGLLGDLLCAIANLLNNGTPLGTILTTLSPDQLTTLTDGLTDLLNAVLEQVTSASAVVSAECDILNLALGPIDLNLLGLQVHLDNCAEGPVTVDVTAEPGAGNLLGNLLCGLAGLLDSNSRATVELLRQIALVIAQLVQ